MVDEWWMVTRQMGDGQVDRWMEGLNGEWGVWMNGEWADGCEVGWLGAGG